MNVKTAARRSFTGRLLLANAAYLLPCALLLSLCVRSESRQMALRQAEVDGVAALRPLLGLLAGLARLSLDPAGKASELEVAEMDRGFQVLEGLAARRGGALALTATGLSAHVRAGAALTGVRAQWDELAREQRAGTAAGQAGRYGSLAINLRTLIAQVGDTSQLTLDQGLDTHYLMETLVDSLPDLLTTVQAASAGDAGGGSETAAQRSTRVIVLASRLDGLAARVESSTRRAIAEERSLSGKDSVLAGELMPALSSMEGSVAAMITALRRRAAAGGAETADDVGATADAAIDTGQQLSTQIAEALGRLLEDQIDDAAQRRDQGVALGGLAMLVVVLFSYVFARDREILAAERDEARRQLGRAPVLPSHGYKAEGAQRQVGHALAGTAGSGPEGVALPVGILPAQGTGKSTEKVSA